MALKSDEVSRKNTKLWDEVYSTPQKYTREYTGPGGFSGTSINPQYLIRRATELWGPLGGRWWFDLREGSERFDTGPAIAWDAEGNAIAYGQVHTLILDLYYPNSDGKDGIGHVWAVGHTPYITYNKRYNEVKHDMEYFKKSITDALKKCLSQLGFAGDVFMGEYDDVNYLAALENEQAILAADKQAEEEARKEQEYLDWLKAIVEELEGAPDMVRLNTSYKSAVRKVAARKDSKAEVRLQKAYSAAKERLKPNPSKEQAEEAETVEEQSDE
jgi:hypothetical protein